MDYVLNQQFENTTVHFDGTHYIGCSFTNCTIVITSLNFNYDRCTFQGSTFKISPKISWLQNVYSLLPSAAKGNSILQA
ncbi:hypothetical protein [Paenibacillus protaetiae]|uniref:Pentapeptide repeat-containing protein n=1 Tax=Paenibacillus protaetiae TaxID=2509456 RepID=A0A4P6F051_9BACL|nr:hypothetical protein [Paenibacillus protaetiae]QAY67963.1 hypothetical protein ET464_17820 [Paenibacillus protaetiae]